MAIPEIVHSRTLDSDIEVLRSLKQCIDPSSIPRYSFLSTWNFNVDPCESNGGNFLGILCTIPLGNYTSRITGIELDGVGYDGFLTPTIGNLTELTILNLSKNKFRGPLPGTIANLNSLKQLSLSENVFTGALPNGITSLMQLELIDVSHNKLTGSIPSTIIGLRRLLHLSLSNNAFSGRIPNLSALWRLQIADLSINQFSGNLPNFPSNLRTLYLRNNKLSGAVTDDIFLLPELIHLNVSVNTFRALEVIEVSGRPTQLQTFEAQQNNLHGHLPRYLVTYENLTSINLQHNQISVTLL
ncbi:hypothetical protein RJ641_025548 [Dillenia turbinata]|uniref:Disease resistance R13L4/SHOC-2-like LRR domain-containing protein n=1 Tax=Dillenia turbinata TaxID=194707 RepID=A0AAN8ZNN4_9MAGN